MNKGRWIAIIIGIIVVVGGLSSPLFYDTSIDESLPGKLNEIEEGLTYEKFTTMDDSRRQMIVDGMSEEIQDMIMQKAATTTTEISEEMNNSNVVTILHTGEFEGLLGHQANGIAKVITTSNSTYLRFENFQVTNGPDLRVYLTQKGDVKNEGFHVAKLKASKGNQNYLLDGIDWQKYDTVIIYCQPFGVHFGQAKLM